MARRSMSEAAIREALLGELDARHAGETGTLIVEELGVAEGAARIDAAVINGSLSGYEIKSDSDTFVRLDRQRAYYDSVFDFVTLVVGEAHTRRALERTPRWWGVWIARPADGGFIEARTAQVNTGIEPRELVRFLWRSEALDLALSLGLRPRRRATRTELWEELVRHSSVPDLAAAVRQTMVNRPAWRSG